jgi:methylmalonyl-CoA mutase cobalamin-binding subunit
VRQLLLINEVLACGYRAGDVVPLPVDEIEALLAECGRRDSASHEPSAEWVRHALKSAREFDRVGFSMQLHQAATAMGLASFIRERAEPLLAEIGEAWARGDIEIRHEHFASEVLEDVLRSLRLPLEAGGRGRPVLLATLPGERHGLGLQVAALAVADAGRCARVLGADTPVEDIVQAAVELDAVAVGISISDFSVNDATSEGVDEIRRQLPAEVKLWLGGAGSEEIESSIAGVQKLQSFDDFERVLQLLED